MKRHGYKLNDFDLIELNEAFAAQSLACIKEMDLDKSRVNVEGGAIAIGHPNGASGGMLVGRLVYALRRRNKKLGLISFCCGGGQGFSLVLENPKA
jgi:acetyl-CoA C-acetyltransferase